MTHEEAVEIVTRAAESLILDAERSRASLERVALVVAVVVGSWAATPVSPSEVHP